PRRLRRRFRKLQMRRTFRQLLLTVLGELLQLSLEGIFGHVSNFSTCHRRARDRCGMVMSLCEHLVCIAQRLSRVLDDVCEAPGGHRRFDRVAKTWLIDTV